MSTPQDSGKLVLSRTLTNGEPSPSSSGSLSSQLTGLAVRLRFGVTFVVSPGSTRTRAAYGAVPTGSEVSSLNERALTGPKAMNPTGTAASRT